MRHCRWKWQKGSMTATAPRQGRSGALACRNGPAPRRPRVRRQPVPRRHLRSHGSRPSTAIASGRETRSPRLFRHAAARRHGSPRSASAPAEPSRENVRGHASCFPVAARPRQLLTIIASLVFLRFILPAVHLARRTPGPVLPDTSHRTSARDHRGASPPRWIVERGTRSDRPCVPHGSSFELQACDIRAFDISDPTPRQSARDGWRPSAGRCPAGG